MYAEIYNIFNIFCVYILNYILFCSGEEICENNDSQNDEEEWPPFRRVGTFDPYSDDPRLAVKRVSKITHYNNIMDNKKYL